MDSVTQIALGSSVGYALLGGKIGRRALIVGAAFGTLPDLDVLIDFGGAVENFVFHRSFSHSLLIQGLLSPFFAWCLLQFRWAKSLSILQWSVAIFAILSTHALLDSFTVYGTQLLWPLTHHPFGLSSIFIVDPVYSLPLLFALLLTSFKRLNAHAHKINVSALILSSIYLVWGLAAKWHIDNKVHLVLTKNGISPSAYVSTPAPFNTLLWRAIATTNTGHYEIYASVFDSPDDVNLRFVPTRNDLLLHIENDIRVNMLKAFTKGLYGVYFHQDQIVISDLRMGLEGYYVFSFVAGTKTGKGFVKGDFNQLVNRPPIDGVHLIFDRISDPAVDLFRLNESK